MSGGAQIWSMEAAWEAAVQLVAAAHGLPADSIAAESRGRGPRPPEAVRQPRKLAFYLAVALSGCDYSSLARHTGLHKDTVSSHCAWAREACATDPELEQLVSVLGSAAIVRLEASAIRQQVQPASRLDMLRGRERLRALQEFMEDLFEQAFEAVSDEGSPFIRHSEASSDAGKKYLRRCA